MGVGCCSLLVSWMLGLGVAIAVDTLWSFLILDSGIWLLAVLYELVWVFG